MSDSEIIEFIEIHDPQVTATMLAGEIRARVQQRRQLGKPHVDFPTYGAVTACPEASQELPFRPNLFHHLRQANRSYNRIETATVLAPSPATQVPVLGRLWSLIREQAHSLVLFYVNRATVEQLKINRHLVSVANELTIMLQEQQATTGRLQQEIEMLREQVERQKEEGK
jgi:hypothetical protein